MREPIDRIVVAPGVRFQDLGDESVLLELESGRYYGLDEVGTRMWSLLVEHGSASAAERVLLEEYDVDVERLRGDLDRFVDSLESESLVTRAPEINDDESPSDGASRSDSAAPTNHSNSR